MRCSHQVLLMLWAFSNSKHLPERVQLKCERVLKELKEYV
jgi:hypothetical protein